MTTAGTARRCGAALGVRRRACRRFAQLDAGPARLRQPDRDRLLRRSRAVLALADMMDLFADELAGLRGRCFPLTFVAPRAFQRFLLWHQPLRGSGLRFVLALDL